ncbi:MAG TPA: DUF892 family protein [Terriglobales bacterium]|nr:DUF892 family protein [Terriglobales bacterium]
MPATPSEHDRYLLHLNHALAMENALLDHLEKRAAATAEPQAQQRLRRHREETAQHADSLRDIIGALGGEPTTAKAVVQSPVSAGLVGKMISALEGGKEDRQLDDGLADYAIESYEAALYSALLLIARNLGYPQHAARFDAIRQQERDLADYLAAALPAAIRQAFPPVSRAA